MKKIKINISSKNDHWKFGGAYDIINEDLNIPPQLQNQYLAIKNQIVAKQNELNILNKNLIKLETQAANIQNQEAKQIKTQAVQANTVKQAPPAAPPVVKESENLDALWKRYISESIEDDKDIIYDEYVDDEIDDKTDDEYIFVLKIMDHNEDDDIIAKFYKNDADDYWKARVVQGSEEPIESMQFDPDMDKITIIDHLGTMFDEIEEIDIDEYDEMLDDKEDIDDEFYNK